MPEPILSIEKTSNVWSYSPAEIRGLLADGETVVNEMNAVRAKDGISDYSFMVFPFAKAYEGFLKKFLLDMQLIKIEDYYSDDIRIGRILNPRFLKEESNVFSRICDHTPEGNQISYTLWEAWKEGRNQVFHYFPHNFRKLEFDDALSIVKSILRAMDLALTHCRVSIGG